MWRGCVLSPLLCNTFLELIIATALEDEEIGMQIGGGKINNLCFTDNTVLLIKSPKELQTVVNKVVEVSENLGMKENIKKTEIQHMGRAHKDFNIVVKNQNLKQTVNFVYMGGCLNSKEETISDIKRWVGIARAIFQALRKVWSARDITKTTKLQVYKTLVS